MNLYGYEGGGCPFHTSRLWATQMARQEKLAALSLLKVGHLQSRESSEVSSTKSPARALFKFSENDFFYLVKIFDLVSNSKD